MKNQKNKIKMNSLESIYLQLTLFQNSLFKVCHFHNLEVDMQILRLEVTISID